MRFKEKPDYRAISRQSIQKDMQREKSRGEPQKPQKNEEPQSNSTRRIAFVGENSSYYKFRQYIVGRLVRLIEKGTYGGWVCEFVHDEDSKALNHYAGWSDSKKQYLFDCIKFK